VMMEEDDSFDFDEEQRIRLQSWMDPLWQAYDVFGSTAASLVPTLLPEFIFAIPKFRTNDDIVAAHWLEPISTGTGRSVPFNGDGGRYQLFFKVD
jgi:hypothetical protein